MEIVSFLLADDTDTAIVLPAGKTVLNGVFDKRLENHDRNLKIEKLLRNVTVISKFIRKPDALDGHIPLYLQQFFSEAGQWKTLKAVAEQIGHIEGNCLNHRNAMNVGKRPNDILGVVQKMVVDLKLQHLDPGLLCLQANLVILLNAGGQTFIQVVEARNEFAKLLVGSAGLHTDGFVMVGFAGIDLTA